jgi:hypothetical protein
MKTDEELKQIAIDIHAGRIFTDRHCKDFQEVTQVFMPLIFVGYVEKAEGEDDGDYLLRKAQSNIMVEDLKKAVMFYEYMDKASPMGINGLPVFMSFHYLDKEEFEKMNVYFKKINEAIEKI